MGKRGESRYKGNHGRSPIEIKKAKDIGVKDRPAYPAWICHDCAMAHGGVITLGHCCTCHEDVCGWCGETKTVAEPRDYKYPKAPCVG